ncbi:tail protein X [Pseudaestuariivita sp.]|uniref:tail protein X n=1 Tax=Pseudaestuariivita sp. TaxID=2211669 RepID=UPI0040592EA3
MTIYRTQQGDMVDEIAWRLFEDEAMAIDIYEANPRLAVVGPVLPSGIELQLPPKRAQKSDQPVRLWSARRAD